MRSTHQIFSTVREEAHHERLQKTPRLLAAEEVAWQGFSSVRPKSKYGAETTDELT